MKSPLKQSPITVIDNAQFLTQDPQYPRAEAVAIVDGKIIALDDAARQFNYATRIDADGAIIVPGFNDVHAHTVWFGQTLLEIDVSHSTTPGNVYQTISQSLKKEAPDSSDKWVIASGFNPNNLEGAEVEIGRLDDAAGGRPLLIKHNSGHAYTVNTKALELAGVDPHNPQTIDGGEIVTDGEGKATGLLDENAMRIIQDILQPEAVVDLVEALERATSHYVTEGLTSVTDAGVAGGWIGHSPREIAAYQQADLRTRMQLMPTIDVLHDVAGHARESAGFGIDTGLRTGFGSERLQIGPTKIFTDGSLLGTTAAMSEDYQCCSHHGYFQGDVREMKSQALKAASMGWSLAMHAIGDAAVEFAIDVIREALSRYGKPAMPHRIEHGGVVQDSHVHEMADAGIILVPQPRFIREFGDSMAAKIGVERTKLSYPAKRLLDAGIVLPGSSDRPVADGSPLKVMEAFVLRETETGQTYGADERISAAEALYAYTAGSAYATGWEGKKGQIKPGQLADMVVLSENPLDIEPQRISSIDIIATMVGGDIVHGNI